MKDFTKCRGNFTWPINIHVAQLANAFKVKIFTSVSVFIVKKITMKINHFFIVKKFTNVKIFNCEKIHKCKNFQLWKNSQMKAKKIYIRELFHECKFWFNFISRHNHWWKIFIREEFHEIAVLLVAWANLNLERLG